MDTSVPQSPGSQPTEIVFVRNLLLEEYKLIQTKIDKLGEDKFKVRAWSFTIVTGVVAGAKLSGGFDNRTTPIILFLCLAVVVAYHIIELRQQQVSHRLGERAKKIERTWKARYALHRRVLPDLATFMMEEEASDRLVGSLSAWRKQFMSEIETWADNQQKAESDRAKQKQAKKRYSLKVYLIRNADNLFYAIQYLVLALFLAAALFNERIVPPVARPQTTSILLSAATNSTTIVITNLNR